MKTIKIFITVCILFITASVTAQNSKDREVMAEAKKAKTTLLTINPELKKYFQNASGYVIFPSIGKGAFLVGGAMGNGVVYDKGKAIGMSNIKKLSIGFQIGGQTFTEVIFFETKEALEKFKEGNYEFAAQISAIAADKGVSGAISYNEGVMVVVLPKAGLMADTSVGGQKFEYISF
jgi:lipid-binding SYLF domain-containing protein